MNIRILVLSILFIGLTVTALSQKISISPFGKVQLGFGAVRGYTDPNYNFFTTGSNEDQPTYQIFRGIDYSFTLGAAFHSPGSDIYDESFFDVFIVHKRLTGSSNATGFTGAGVRVRYRFFFGGILIGMAGNKHELPVELDSQNTALSSGNLHGITPMFNLGVRVPLNAGHTLFLELPVDFVIPRNRLDDAPAGSAALYEWYSFSLGICYNLPSIGSESDYKKISSN